MNEKPSGKDVARPQTAGIAPGRLVRLALKELREILRDRRTIVTLVLMPLLVYPLLGVIVTKFIAFEPVENTVRVLVATEQDKQELLEILERCDELIASEAYQSREVTIDVTAANDGDEDSVAEGPSAGRGSPDEMAGDDTDDGNGASGAGQAAGSAGAEVAEADESPKLIDEIKQALVGGELQLEITPLFTENIPSDVETQRQAVTGEVISGQFDLGVVFDRFPESRRTETALGKVRFVEFVLDDANPTATAGRDILLAKLKTLQEFFVGGTLRKMRFSIRACSFRTVKFKTEAKQEADQAPSLLTFFPLMLVLMTMTGAVYPAIDLTAGERERGTMEILVAAPVSRMSLLFGKFVAVLAVAMLTAVFNMVAMLVTTYAIGFDQFVFGENGLSLTILLQILGLLFVFASFFSAVLLSLTSFARSFKEAQAYLIPMMLIALAPGVVSLLPGVELNLSLAVVPLLNIVLLGRDVLSGETDLVLTFVVICSTVIYGLLAMSFAARIFGTDAILSGGSNSWSTLWQRPEKTKGPGISQGMLALAILFPLFIVLSGLSARLDFDFSGKLILNALILLLLFVILPVAMAAAMRLDFGKTFQLFRPRAITVVLAVLFGLSVWTLVYEIEVVLLSNERIDALKAVFEKIDRSLTDAPLALKLVCLAVAPAVCEEVFFRGFLLSSLRKSTRVVYAVLGSAVLFGIFHVIVPGAVMYERMVPSTLLGILLAIICIRTGSLFPGMLMHVIHNGLLLTIAHFERESSEFLVGLGFDLEGKQHLPLLVLGLAAIPMLAAAALLLFLPPAVPKEANPPGK